MKAAARTARAEIRAVHPEGAENVEISLEGPPAGLLALYSAITQDLMEAFTEKGGLPSFMAVEMIASAAGKGLAMAEKE